MKQTYVLLIIALLTIASCKKETPEDLCENVVCLNGGACSNGNCICTNGYTGEHCEVPPVNDPCAGITCLNGGYCANGVCICPQGYTGANCSQIVAPTRIKVNSIKVAAFTDADQSGVYFDTGDYPDMYVVIKLGTTEVYTAINSYALNANPSSDYIFTPSPALYLNSPTTEYSISTYDFDAIGANDFMQGFNFTPFEAANGFPSTIVVANASLPYHNLFRYELNVTYEW